MGEIVRYLPDRNKRNLSVSETVATARVAPKICQGQPQQCTQSAPDFIKIGSLSAETPNNKLSNLSLAPLRLIK